MGDGSIEVGEPHHDVFTILIDTSTMEVQTSEAESLACILIHPGYDDNLR